MITLTSKHKQFIRKHTLNGHFFMNLLLGLFFIIFMKRIFVAVGIFLLFSAFRELSFVFSVYRNKANLTPALILEKQQLYPYSRKGNKFYAILQFPNGEIVKHRITFHHYQRVNEGEMGVVIKGMFIERFYTFNEMAS